MLKKKTFGHFLTSSEDKSFFVKKEDVHVTLPIGDKIFSHLVCFILLSSDHAKTFYIYIGYIIISVALSRAAYK